MRRKVMTPPKLSPALARQGLVAFVGFGGVGLLMLVGAKGLGVTGPAAQAWFSSVADSPWALVAAIAAFAALAFLGAPQFVLIAAAVAAFGPWRGGAFSWIGTLVSALVGFGLGRRFAGRLLRDYGGAGLRRFLTLVGRNGLMASLAVRLVPAAPFIIINMAAGATPMSLAQFALGTAIGIIPKIVITAIGATGAGRALARGQVGTGTGLILGALGLWILLGLAARAWTRGWRAPEEP